MVCASYPPCGAYGHLQVLWLSRCAAMSGACRRGRPEDADLAVTGYTGAVGAGVPGRHDGACGVRQDTDLWQI
ncbi:hypothetical protein [uncultured Duncaniella sp.]|uniref:hypothetical protein n=1 Tax=uncultured Duncaniella sp. TaxID=2768039 RepID=UPI00265F32D4|nr:hypothetical protein [uncultured Duncaniella sp.]